MRIVTQLMLAPSAFGLMALLAFMLNPFLFVLGGILLLILTAAIPASVENYAAEEARKKFEGRPMKDLHLNEEYFILSIIQRPYDCLVELSDENDNEFIWKVGHDIIKSIGNRKRIRLIVGDDGETKFEYPT